MQSSDLKGEPEIVVVDASAEAVVVNEEEDTTGSKPKKDNKKSWDVSLCGNENRTGRNVRPGTTNISVKLCGNSYFKLPKDPVDGSHYRFVMINLCGDAKLVVPTNTKVNLCRVALCGDKKITLNENEDVPDGPEIKVTLVQLCGNVRFINHGEEEEPSGKNM